VSRLVSPASSGQRERGPSRRPRSRGIESRVRTHSARVRVPAISPAWRQLRQLLARRRGPHENTTTRAFLFPSDIVRESRPAAFQGRTRAPDKTGGGRGRTSRVSASSNDGDAYESRFNALLTRPDVAELSPYLSLSLSRFFISLPSLPSFNYYTGREREREGERETCIYLSQGSRFSSARSTTTPDLKRRRLCPH